MVADVALNLTGIGPCILPERPSYGLAPKEFFRAKRRTNARIEQIEIGVPLETKLADDRRPPLPHVPGSAPREHLPANRLRVAAEKFADTVRRERIDHVPPWKRSPLIPFSGQARKRRGTAWPTSCSSASAELYRHPL